MIHNKTKIPLHFVLLHLELIWKRGNHFISKIIVSELYHAEKEVQKTDSFLNKMSYVAKANIKVHENNFITTGTS